MKQKVTVGEPVQDTTLPYTEMMPGIVYVVVGRTNREQLAVRGNKEVVYFSEGGWDHANSPMLRVRLLRKGEVVTVENT